MLPQRPTTLVLRKTRLATTTSHTTFQMPKPHNLDAHLLRIRARPILEAISRTNPSVFRLHPSVSFAPVFHLGLKSHHLKLLRRRPNWDAVFCSYRTRATSWLSIHPKEYVAHPSAIVCHLLTTLSLGEQHIFPS